ncbi:MAG: FCD domain-containing protein [Propionibacteriales bacterium]|nr:FCD domain-containing protein [Propionibacteriales bacterium]
MRAPEPDEPAAVMPPTSKATYVIERLRQEIIQGIIRPGELLRQADLARRYGVSPTPVREALRLLEAEGTISYVPHRGASVTELNPNHVKDLYQLRAAVEGLATRLAVERMSDETLQHIRVLHERLATTREGDDPRKLSAWNQEFHLAICQAASPVVTSHASILWRMFPTEATLWRLPYRDSLVAQHRAVVDAMVDRDPSRAEASMAEHVLAAGAYRQRDLEAQ